MVDGVPQGSILVSLMFNVIEGKAFAENSRSASIVSLLFSTKANIKRRKKMGGPRPTPLGSTGTLNQRHHLSVTHTFDGYLRHGLNHPQGGHGHAGVVGRLPDVGELQHVPPDGHVVLGRQVLGSEHPLHVRHGGAHRHARDVDAAARHDLVVSGRDGESRGHSTHCERRGAV